ncbi:acyltransferase domain-containing protein [Streptomyces malaysiensis]|uniref:Malonyl-CoA:ACP transacylase (MAT) domain-containing protein n=1 Tax=Streptomyces malaysiensis TaxID=92644 RepID=A0A2J7YNE9_STRMQ|nr:acyltransferase domain-containing protein [Streptomyces malaysiensis]PNG89543.1 hypothetical protein SMF913_25008 [Streptomyces malaysiensis]
MVSLGVDGLRVLAAGGVGDDVVAGRVAVVVGRMVFVFPGRGSQWVGMARELMGGSLVFAARMGECGQVVELFTGWCLVDVLGGVEVLERAGVVQSVVWVVVVWRSLGVVPDAVLGYFRGEVAAAVVAGALLLEEGACVVALCAGTVGVLAGCGGMTSLVLSARGVRALIGPGFSVAAVIGPSSVVVVGVPEVLAGWRRWPGSGMSVLAGCPDSVLRSSAPIETKAVWVGVLPDAVRREGSGFRSTRMVAGWAGERPGRPLRGYRWAKSSSCHGRSGRSLVHIAVVPAGLLARAARASEAGRAHRNGGGGSTGTSAHRSSELPELAC